MNWTKIRTDEHPKNFDRGISEKSNKSVLVCKWDVFQEIVFVEKFKLYIPLFKSF